MYNSGIGTPYWFEWEIGILECLNMLQDTSIESVILQSTDFQALDDVVVNYSDKSILNIQVKHTDEDANFTYSFLASGKKPLLNALALEWKNNKDNYNFKGIQIVTNKKWGPQETDGKCSMDDFISKVFPCLQDNYNYTSAKPNEQKAIEWYRENLEINLDSNEAACFTKIFSFRKESCLADVEEKIRVKIGEILGTDNSDAIDFCLNSLLSKLNIWATSRREKQEITRENVYGALCYTEPDVPSYELCPEKPILPSRQRFGETFIDDIKKNSNHIIFLEGLPGCGKTNFISYLSQMNESIVDFRFYTYLPVNKVDGSYSDDEGFYLGNILWRSILVQLKKKFEENNLLSVVKFPLIYQFMSVSEMRKTVIHFLPEYAKCIGRPCYFFIDGLDHAARSKDARNSFLSQLPRPEEIGDDFYFVLVGQPINDGCNIDLISDDSELIALYRLTNSWIKEYIENDREYNRLETLRSYNYEIISRISSSEIREKLMAKGLYDKAEHKDFSVETGRDYNLEIINLLKEDGYNEKAEGVILTQIDKREIGLHKLIMEAGDIIAQKHMEEYVNRCVVKFILSESKYGYIGSGISDVFERYYEMFNDNTWNLLFENIVTRFAESDYGIIALLWGDFTIFSIYYLSRIDKDKIKALFDCLCKTHESLSSANGRVKIKEEKLILDENITSLSDMVNFQLNI